MDIWSPYLHLATWTVINFLCVCSHEVTVRGSDLKPCENDKQVCVTDLRNCGPRPPSSILRTLNMSCYYQISYNSMTCKWSEESNGHTESEVSLIFSKANILSCKAILNPIAVLNIIARIRNYMMGSEIWSKPHTVYLYAAVKPSQPVLTVLGSTVDSVDVSWRSTNHGSCRLRYGVNRTHTWTQAADSIPARKDQTLTYKIKDLLPFTVYRAAVACREVSNIWSDWSSDITTRTQDRVPSRTPEVCYRVEKNDSGQSFFLHLMWKTSSLQDLDLSEVGGHILGYQVSYKPVKKQQLQDHLIQNVTEPTALLVVEEGNCSVTVTAFNMAGYGPAAHLSVDVQRQSTLPSVTGVWVSSSFPAMKGLQVQWEISMASPSVPPVSHFAVQWRLERHPSTSRWITVDGFNTSTVIQDVDPDKFYLISVSPVYNQQCGPPQSLPASLQQGALMEATRLTMVGVTKTTVTVRWEWQRKSGNIRVNTYRVILRRDSEEQSLPLWSGQWGHTFSNLTPNTEYSLLLSADNISRNILPVKTDFDEVPAVATVTPLLLLAVTVFIISILSRTLYKSYFFPPISSPRGSTTGQWLMDPNHQKTAQRNILDIEDFQVTDVLGEKSFILVGANSLHSSEEDIHEDTSLLSISHIIKMSALKLETEYVSEAPVITKHQLLSLRSCHPDSAVKSHHPDSVFMSEKSQAAAAALLHQMQDVVFFPQKKEESKPIDMSETSHHKETALKPCFREFVANTNSHCAYQMTCEAEYMVSSSFLGKTDVETVSGQIDSSYLICESDYIANSCFTAQTANKDTTSSFITTC